MYLRQPVAGYAQRIIENEKYDKNYLSKVTTFFQRLEIALSARGKSKSALASHLSMALSGISRWRDSIPRAERVQEITTWLNVSGKWLMTGEGEMYPVKIGEKKPGDVFRSGEVKEFPPGAENNLPVPQGAYATAKEVHDLRDQVARLERMMLRLLDAQQAAEDRH